MKQLKVTCDVCGAPAVLRDSAMIYRGKSYGLMWICSRYPKCDSYVCVHPGTTVPMGRLADRHLRYWKHRAHEAFDKLWKTPNRLNRKDAYKWLAEKMSLPRSKCHIGMFDVEQCKTVIQLCGERVD